MSFLNLKILKGKPTKFLRIMPHLKNLKKINFLKKKFKKKKKTKIATHMDL
jgi:hypothetical protein